VKSVRATLSALVRVCVAPALVGAILRAREAESSLLDDATRHVDHVNTVIASELSDYESNARMALVLVEQATRFREAMTAHDAPGAQGLVTLLAKVYPHRIVCAADAHGDLLALGNGQRAPTSLRAVISEDLYRQVEEHVDAEPLQRIRVKGREQEVMAYRLRDLREPRASA
jgi:hypothetical protein